MKDIPTSPRSFLRRRMYLVDPAFQWKHALSIAAVIFFISSLISLAIFGTLHEQARLRAADPQNYVADVRPVIMMFAIGCSALTAGGVGLWTIIVTHRMCGPMYVMDRCFRELTAGRLPKLRALRKNDEFKELYNTFSEAVEAIRRRAKIDLEVVNQLLELIEKNAKARSDVQHAALLAMTPHLERLQGDLTYLLNERGEAVIIGGASEPATTQTAPASPLPA